ncbi:hypothetical protein ABH922_001379 [Rhodococcus sp. 27YEA15]|uniref:STM4015 family protein n=1 Tax=Rhodococcus sp. 27YEA15 TaxID=3156259 RepID=UPI003C7C660F
MIINHLTHLYGLPVFDLPDAHAPEVPLPAAGSVAWRIEVDPYANNAEEFAAAWGRFVESVDLTAVQALVIGQWGESFESNSSTVISSIVALRERFTSLRALFVGDLVQEQAEISWIEQSDITPILETFPELVELGVRGGTGLGFTAVAHRNLRKLVVETGGLDVAVVQGIIGSDIPGLEHLELWLGDEGYGANSTPDDLAPLVDGTRFPALRYLGVRNSDIQDGFAALLAQAPIVARLETLDLSLGTLTDEGGAALVAGQSMSNLTLLDLHHHFLSTAAVTSVTEHFAAAGVRVDLSEKLTPDVGGDDVWRYVAVSE